MSDKQRYVVRVERDDPDWFLPVPQIGSATQARYLGEADRMVADLVAIQTGVDRGDVEVELDLPDIPAAIAAREAIQRAKEAEKVAASTVAAAVSEVREQGISVRDIATLIGISQTSSMPPWATIR